MKEQVAERLLAMVEQMRAERQYTEKRRAIMIRIIANADKLRKDIQRLDDLEREGVSDGN